MKKLLIVLTASVVATMAYGQGLLQIGNSSSLSVIRTNNGTTGVGNIRGSSGSYIFGVFVGASGASADQLLLAYYATNSPLVAGTMVSQNNKLIQASAGLLPGSLPFTTGVGDTIETQVRGWSSNLGTDWATVTNNVALNHTTDGLTGWYGVSTLGTYILAAASPPPPAIMKTAVTDPTGYTMIGGFDLTPIPEPSTIALVGLGLTGLIFIRRRK